MFRQYWQIAGPRATARGRTGVLEIYNVKISPQRWQNQPLEGTIGYEVGSREWRCCDAFRISLYSTLRQTALLLGNC
jgi:hypothetical protein